MKAQRQQVFRFGNSARRLKAKADPQQIGEELERIRIKHGHLRPEAVVSESEAEDAVLHGQFTWDDTDAAREWRKHEARTVIRSIEVVFVSKDRGEETEHSVRQYVSVIADGEKDPSYEPVEYAVRNVDLRAQMLDNAKRDLVAFRAKYGAYAEIAKMGAEFFGQWQAEGESVTKNEAAM